LTLNTAPIVSVQLFDIDEIRRLAREQLLPLATSPGSAHGVNRVLVKGLADCGLLPCLFPSSLGGSGNLSGVDAVTLCRLREGLAYEMTEAESALALQGLGSYPILQSGSNALRERWIPEVAAGRAIAAFALSELESGSDAAALACVAVPDGSGFRLSGVKRWISNAPDADVYTVFARTGEAGPRGVTAFVVSGDSPGVSGKALDMVAPHAIGELELDGVFVERDDVLGDLGGGFKVAMRTLDLFRPSVGAFAVGMAEAALDRSIAYASQREAFGQPIREFQAISHRLADMATKIQAARLLVYCAAEAYNAQSPDVTKLSAMAKLFATEAAQEVVDCAVQIHGAAGLQRGHPIELAYREVRAPRIYEGTSEIQRTIIARQLFR